MAQLCPNNWLLLTAKQKAICTSELTAGFSELICLLVLSCSADPDREGRVYMGQGDLDSSVGGEITCVVILFGLTILQPLVRAAGDDSFIPKLPSAAPVPLC